MGITIERKKGGDNASLESHRRRCGGGRYAHGGMDAKHSPCLAGVICGDNRHDSRQGKPGVSNVGDHYHADMVPVLPSGSHVPDVHRGRPNLSGAIGRRRGGKCLGIALDRVDARRRTRRGGRYPDSDDIRSLRPSRAEDAGAHLGTAAIARAFDSRPVSARAVVSAFSSVTAATGLMTREVAWLPCHPRD